MLSSNSLQQPYETTYHHIQSDEETETFYPKSQIAKAIENIIPKYSWQSCETSNI